MFIGLLVTLKVKVEQVFLFLIKVAKLTITGLGNAPSHRTFDLICMVSRLRDNIFGRLSPSVSAYNGKMNSVPQKIIYLKR